MKARFLAFLATSIAANLTSAFAADILAATIQGEWWQIARLAWKPQAATPIPPTK